MKLVGTATILFLCMFTPAQTKQKPGVHDLPIPLILSECFVLLDKTIPDEEITLIKTLWEDSIYPNSAFTYETDFFHAWKLYEGLGFTKYVNKLGLRGSHEIYETILNSYHRYLNRDSI